jgi:hypothetical protein
MSWAKPLAKGLTQRWEFLQRFLDDADDGRRSARNVAREHGLRLRMIAATLGCRLSRYWTPDEVTRLVENHGLVHRYAPSRQVIAAGDAHSPLTYLATILDRALTNDTAVVPQPSPVRAAWIAERAASHPATATTDRQQLHAQLDERAATAAAATGAGLQAFRAARARLGHQPSPAATSAAAPASSEVEWPAHALPGTGLPPGRKPVADSAFTADGLDDAGPTPSQAGDVRPR